jgi:hypothetical protein
MNTLTLKFSQASPPSPQVIRHEVIQEKMGYMRYAVRKLAHRVAHISHLLLLIHTIHAIIAV